MNNEVVLITGASKGLGLAVAHLLARRGHPLVINARGEELRDAEQELAKLTDELAVRADVSEEAEEIAGAALSRFGRSEGRSKNDSQLGRRRETPLAEHPC